MCKELMVRWVSRQLGPLRILHSQYRYTFPREIAVKWAAESQQVIQTYLF